MGAGHSGSTILGVTLGNCENVFYAGEVEEWLVAAGTSPIGGNDRSRFWDQVGAQVRDATELYGHEANRCLERSSAIFRVGCWRSRRRLRAPYRRVAGELIQAIANTADSTIVVDSSHFPLRANELKRVAGIELYLVFLVRRPLDVVASELRSIHRHLVAERRLRTLVVNANLWLTHLVCVFVFLRHQRSRRLFLRHEDFLADPPRALRGILDMVGSDAQIPDLDALRTGFPLLANKLIHSQSVQLRAAPAAPLPPSSLTALLQLPWAWVFSRLRPAFRDV
jgi:hypothetical protein